MAIFGFFNKSGPSGSEEKEGKKAAEGSGAGGGAAPGAEGGGGGGKGGMEFSPEKAKRFFTHAKNVHETSQYEYAMSLWLQGLRFEPSNLEAVQAYFASSEGFLNSGKTAVSKDTMSAIAGSSPVHRFVAGLLNWSLRLRDAEAAVRVFLMSVELGLRDVALWIAPRALKVAAGSERPRKDHFVRMMKALASIEAADLGVQAGELAMRLDPSDNALAADVKNLSAQATMNKGGYESTGQEGGFRSNIKDAEKQRLINEERQMAKSEEGQQRAILAAKAEYEANPSDKPTIRKYFKALAERGTATDEQTAIDVAERAYKDTQEFSFRALAGEMRMKRGRRGLVALRKAKDAAPNDAAAVEAFLKAEQAQLELEISEYEPRVTAYPTDLAIKFELGKRYYLNKQYEQAIEQFQRAKDDAKQTVQVRLYLGQAFMALSWLDEAVETFKQALEINGDQNDEVALSLKYNLMLAMLKQAEEQKDLSKALEADKLAGAVAMQQIGYMDIRARRDQAKALIAQLRQSGGGGGG